MQKYNVNTDFENRKNQLTFLVRYQKDIETVKSQLETLYMYNKRRNPELAKKIKEDLLWVRSDKELHKIDRTRKRI